MVEKIRIDIDTYDNLIRQMCHKINKDKYKFVYGVPMGGTLIAKDVANQTGLIQVDALNDYNPKNVLIVDDLIDSGRTRELYKDYDFVTLIDKQTQPEYMNKWIEFWYEKTESDDNSLITRMLERIGENPNRLGLQETPARVIKMWNEIYRGYDEKQKPKITTFSNNEDGLCYDEMIMDAGSYYSQCEHHMVPFFGKYYFAYIPDKKILGLSKVARIVDYYSAKLQVQERLTKEIVDELEKVLEPKGIALVMMGEHLCKTMRGAKKKGLMKTSVMRGAFRTNQSVRNEFLQLMRTGGIVNE